MVEVSRGDMSDSRLHQRNRQAASRVWTRQASPDTDVTPVGRTVDFQQLKAWFVFYKKWKQGQQKLGGGFKYFLFSPLFGEDSHFD